MAHLSASPTRTVNLPPIRPTSSIADPQPLAFNTASLYPIPPINSTSSSSDQGSFDDLALSTKLSNVEAQRIMAVLLELLRKISLIALLPDVTDRRAQSVFTQDTLSLISEHRMLEQRYKALVDSPDYMRNENGNELKEIISQLRSSTRSLYRHFSQNPTALNKLRYLKSTKPPAVAHFEQLLNEVRLLVYDRLKTSVEEEKAKQDQLSVIIAKEQKTSNDVAVLKEELEKAKRERSNEVSKRNDTIRRLKEELREIKHQAEETTKRLESRSKQKEDLDIQQFRERDAALQQEIASLRSQHEELCKKHREEEAQLRKKKFKIESEVENWIHKYDQDMDEKQNEIEDITAIFTEEKAQLDDLQKRFAGLQRDFQQIQEERRIAQELKKEQERVMRRMTDAAVLIQSVWRGFKIRKDLKKKKDKGGKEKKGKKGKK
ncbi:hypothetical protein BJ742DRAFT_840660 [Cladochytrium replicatum]|nr:hypothetical protein BJ742DRAFT_840660 [Cladochytrium replicatum]